MFRNATTPALRNKQRLLQNRVLFCRFLSLLDYYGTKKLRTPEEFLKSATNRQFELKKFLVSSRRFLVFCKSTSLSVESIRINSIEIS